MNLKILLVALLTMASASCVTNSPQQESARLNSLGISSRGLGNYSEAIDYYNRAIKLNPNNDLAYYNRAISYLKLGKKLKAVKDYTSAIEIQPEDADYYYNRASVLNDLGKYRDALKDTDRCLALADPQADVYFVRAQAYIGNRKYEKALVSINKSIKIEPKKAYNYNTRGIIYERLGQKSKAKKDFALSSKMRGGKGSSSGGRSSVNLSSLGLKSFFRKASQRDQAKFLKECDEGVQMSCVHYYNSQSVEKRQDPKSKKIFKKICSAPGYKCFTLPNTDKETVEKFKKSNGYYSVTSSLITTKEGKMSGYYILQKSK